MVSLDKAKIGDAAEIKKLLFATWSCAYKNILTKKALETVTSEWHSLETLTNQIRNPLITFLVARDGKKIAGICNTSEVTNPKKVNIQRLHVLPDFQHQGIGTKLINKVMENYPETETFDLEVEIENKPAMDFYSRLGFVPVGKTVFEIENVTMPCVVMEKRTNA